MIMVSPAGELEKNPVVVCRRPYSIGELARSKNVEIHGGSTSVFIPYGMDGKDASRRAPYCDLKSAPDALQQLPEVVYSNELSDCYGGSSQLEQLLRQVNSFPSLTSLGCGLEVSPYDGGYLAYGYLDLARFPLEKNSFSSTMQLAQRLMAVLGEFACASKKFVITVKVGIYELRPIFILDVEAVGAGTTAGDAFNNWEGGLHLIGDALKQVEDGWHFIR
ncbi:hypothetical protein FV139_02980 [Parahaliea maris]|uniref:Uncharacterized protein n=1 Tax=Parahaliea maris TaxID=2716870 RepID=A0A5C9A694_9GAMM|nr:hypothetical protein [Parahaliea maris]TXS96463.1 hypothetical protein FV139_02980 [Parahaliea maris]